MEKVYDLLSEYGLFYNHYIGFNLEQFLENQAAKEVKFPKKHTVNIPDIMGMAFNYRGTIEIKDFDKFSQTFQFEHQRDLYPEWLFSSAFIRSFVDGGKVVFVFDINSYREIYKKAFPLMEAGDLFFKKILKEYKLKNVFDPEKANEFIKNSLEQSFNEITERLDESEVQKKLGQRLFQLISDEYQNALRSVKKNEHNGKNRRTIKQLRISL